MVKHNSKFLPFPSFLPSPGASNRVTEFRAILSFSSTRLSGLQPSLALYSSLNKFNLFRISRPCSISTQSVVKMRALSSACWLLISTVSLTTANGNHQHVGRNLNHHHHRSQRELASSPPSYPSPWMDPKAAEWQDAYVKAKKFVSKLTLLEKVNLTTGVG